MENARGPRGLNMKCNQASSLPARCLGAFARLDQCAELIGLIPGLKVVLIDRCDAPGSCGHVLDNTCDE